MPSFGWRSLDLEALVLPAGGQLGEQLQALMEHFLRQNNLLIWVNRFDRGSVQCCTTRLVQPSAAFFHGVLQYWETSAEEVFDRIYRYYSEEDTRGVTLLLKHRASFVILYNCGGFGKLGQSLLVNKTGRFMTLRDGSVLSWANGEVLLTSYENIQQLRRWQNIGKALGPREQTSAEDFSTASGTLVELAFPGPGEAYPSEQPLEKTGELRYHWGSGEVRQSWFELQQRNLRGTQLQMLRRILHHPQKTRAENQSRVVGLLRELGETLRSCRREGVQEATGKKVAHGFFFWGKSDTGKTQLAKLLGQALRGDGEMVSLGLGNFEQDTPDTASVLLMDDLTPEDKLSRLKALISNSGFRMQRKHRVSVTRSFGHMPVFITSNYCREELLVDYPTDRGPFNGRFPVQLELVAAP